MDLVEFLKHNWFLISLIAGAIGTTIRLTRTISDFDKKISGKLEDHSDKLDHMESQQKDMMGELERVKCHVDEREEKRADTEERTRIIMNGTEATLISLSSQGHDGPVTESLKEIRDYKARKASEW